MLDSTGSIQPHSAPQEQARAWPYTAWHGSQGWRNWVSEQAKHAGHALRSQITPRCQDMPLLARDLTETKAGEARVAT